MLDRKNCVVLACCCFAISACSDGAIWPFYTPYMQVRQLCKNVAGAAESWQQYRLAPENQGSKVAMAEQSQSAMRSAAKEYHAKLAARHPDEAVLNRFYLRELNRAINTFLNNEDLPAAEMRDLVLERCREQLDEMQSKLE